MVRNLLHAESRSVLHEALVGLTENRVDRLGKGVAREDEGQALNHHKLHSADGVVALSGSVHKNGGVHTHSSYKHK